MVFSSSIFVFFFLPVVLVFYAVAPQATKNVLLLIASLLFYAWGEGWLVVLLLGSTVFNYGIALLIERHKSSEWAIPILTLGVCIDLALLGYYKYANFLVENFNLLIANFGFESIGIDVVLLPIGISFFTFQSISYLVDVYRGTAQAQRRFIDAALYIALFPQLIAGPIVRYHDIDRQIRERCVTLDLFAEGTRRFIIGLAKKVLIANPLGYAADQIFSIPGAELTPELAWLGILCYTLQIYFDFSGYSDMAIGLGKMFGFRFLENFNYPYVARSIREFWRRWHISLSSWFRDYLYVPLGGSRVSRGRLYANLVLVFFLCGLWHGASWTFAFWGIYHGMFLVLERVGFDRIIDWLWKPFQHLYALLVVIVGWVFFRADDHIYAMEFLRAMFGIGEGDEGDRVLHPIGLYLTNEVAIVLAVGAVASTGIYNKIMARGQKLADSTNILNTDQAGGPQILRYVEPFYLLLIFILVATYLATGTYNPFIYFRF